MVHSFAAVLRGALACLACLACDGEWQPGAESDAGPADLGPELPREEPPTQDEPRPAPGARLLVPGPTTLVGVSGEHALSSDGRWTAVTVDRSGDHALLLVEIASGTSRVIAEHLDAEPFDARWQGDVLVIGSQRRTPATLPFRGDILLLRPAWQRTQRAVAATGQSCDVGPGGKSVACVVDHDSKEQTFAVALGAVDGETEARPALSRQHYDDTHSYALLWTPSGDRYVVSSRDSSTGPERIRVVSAPGGEIEATLTDGSRPRVAPDGRRILFLAGGDLFDASLEPLGSTPRLLAKNIAEANYFGAGAILAVAPTDDRHFDLLRIRDADGTISVRTLAANAEGLLTAKAEPARIAIVGSNQIRTLDGDGTILCKTDFSAPLSRFAFLAPRGDQLVFIDQAEIFLGVGRGRLLDLATCATQPLVPLLRWAVWDTDRLLLASTSNGRTGNVSLFDPGGGKLLPLQAGGRVPFALSESRRSILFTIDRGPDAGLYELAL